MKNNIMTQEQINLLLKDISARLPYGVKASTKLGNNIIVSFIGEDTIIGEDGDSYDISFITPYLFPLSSMTEEQYNEMEKIVLEDYLENIQITKEMREKVDFITQFPIYYSNLIDWFNRNHFDYRGLIEMGLAIDATNLNIY